MPVKVVTEPTNEPLDLEEAKLFLRVDHDDENGLIMSFIKTARMYIETITRRTLPITGWELVQDSFDQKIICPYPPLISVESVSYKDKAGNVTTLNESDYLVDSDHEPGVIVPVDGWPNFEPYPINPVTIKYQAGYQNVPEPFLHAIKLMVSHMYEHRETVIESKTYQVPLSVESLIAPYKSGWF